MNRHTYVSPFGNVLIEEEDGLLLQVIFTKEDEIFHDNSETIKLCLLQLKEYFAGERKLFDLPLAISGTNFQEQVWDAVSYIPYGKTASYKDIGVTLNNLGAIRAIGAANGKNNFHIIIPCHRIIGADGSLTGYAGGLEIKKQLLILEGAIKENQMRLF